jgi:3-phosphoshikimate 1-carboxyvinyltransferase
MKERPIGPLVDALRALGANIEYASNEGYPPLRIHTPDFEVNTSQIEVKSDISSQYLTALMLLAPTLPNGLTIKILGDLVSESYLLLTIKVLGDFGIECDYNGKTITIPSQAYTPHPYQVEADWSACSYYYAIAALADEAEIRLSGLFKDSGQGDSALTKIGNLLGIKSQFSDNDLILSKSKIPHRFSYNFINQPDIAQTVAVICAARGVGGKFSGLKTLRIKETDRISALDKELSKVNARFVLDSWQGDNEEYKVVGSVKSISDHPPRFDTYHDHRMAMAFAPLSLLFPIEINDPMVVSKSYPAFWDDLRKLGFDVEELN